MSAAAVYLDGSLAYLITKRDDTVYVRFSIGPNRVGGPMGMMCVSELREIVTGHGEIPWGRVYVVICGPGSQFVYYEVVKGKDGVDMNGLVGWTMEWIWKQLN